MFPKEQHLIIFEFLYGGADLKRFDFNNHSEAWSVIHQTALAIAVAGAHSSSQMAADLEKFEFNDQSEALQLKACVKIEEGLYGKVFSAEAGIILQ